MLPVHKTRVRFFRIRLTETLLPGQSIKGGPRWSSRWTIETGM
jgi:hypothetical protein